MTRVRRLRPSYLTVFRRTGARHNRKQWLNEQPCLRAGPCDAPVALVDPRVRRIEVGWRDAASGWRWDVVPAGGVIDLGGHALIDHDALYELSTSRASTR